MLEETTELIEDMYKYKEKLKKKIEELENEVKVINEKITGAYALIEKNPPSKK